MLERWLDRGFTACPEEFLEEAQAGKGGGILYTFALYERSYILCHITRRHFCYILQRLVLCAGAGGPEFWSILPELEPQFVQLRQNSGSTYLCCKLLSFFSPSRICFSGAGREKPEVCTALYIAMSGTEIVLQVVAKIASCDIALRVCCW